MLSLKNYKKPFGVKNYLNTCVEFFPAPLPRTSLISDEEFLKPYDLFQNSRDYGFEPVFIPPDGEITICDLDLNSFELVPDTDQTISGREFLKFQLQKVNIETLIQLPTRVDFTLPDELITSLLNDTLDPAIELDNWGYPKDESKYPYWLSFTDNLFSIYKPAEKAYVKEWENAHEIGKKFLQEFKISHTDFILDPIVNAIFDDAWGIYNYWGQPIQNLADSRMSYANWNWPLMVMYSGKMWPQFSMGWPNFHSPSFSIYDVHIRNNDEGQPE